MGNTPGKLLFARTHACLDLNLGGGVLSKCICHCDAHGDRAPSTCRVLVGDAAFFILTNVGLGSGCGVSWSLGFVCWLVSEAVATICESSGEFWVGVGGTNQGLAPESIQFDGVCVCVCVCVCV